METLDRSHVICHMESTIDGKIDSGIKGKNVLDDFYETYSQLEKELHADAWMCGRVTAEIFAESVGTPLPAATQEIDQVDFRSSVIGSGHFIAIDARGQLRWTDNTLVFGDQSRHPLIIAVTTQTPREYLAYLRAKDISYICSGQDEIDFQELLQKLKKDYEVNTLLLEGGAHTNGSIMAADLVDEISLVITPLVLNRENSPSVFERDTEELNVKKYQLSEVRKMKNDSVWLRYKRNSDT